MVVAMFVNIAFAERITLSRYGRGYALSKDGTPFLVKGVCYNHVPPGQTPYTYDMLRDKLQPWLDDGDLMQRMGVNAVRVYYVPHDPEYLRRFIRKMYNLYGIRTLVPLFLPSAYYDYSNPEIIKEVLKRNILIVEKLKGEEGVLGWLIGNEIDEYFVDEKAGWELPGADNLTSPYRRARARAEIVFSIVNMIAKIVKERDYRPVGVSLGGSGMFLDVAEKKCPDVDFLGVNFYGGTSLGSWWSRVRDISKPVLVTEFGYDAFNTRTGKEDEESQQKYILKLWRDIEKHSFLKSKSPYSLGGFVFEWNDEWWKYDLGDPDKHETKGSWSNPSWADYTSENPMNVQEEWFGLFRLEVVKGENSFASGTFKGINNGKEETFRKVPREVFYMLSHLWSD